MADTKKILEGLQIIVTDLSQQADGHAIQSKIFDAQGFSKLGEKYAEYAAEERGYVDKCTDTDNRCAVAQLRLGVRCSQCGAAAEEKGGGMTDLSYQK